MSMLKWLSDKWKQYRLKHHDCKNNLVYVESYRVRYTNESSTIESTTCVYKCKVCGKQIDID